MHRLKHSLFQIIHYLFLVIINYYCSIFLFQRIFKLKTETVEELYDKYQNISYSSNEFQAWAFS